MAGVLDREEDAPFWSRLTELRTELPDSVRGALAGSWSRAAQMEHASVASFARFSLQLMAVAAPPHLVEGAHRAAIDEVHHARICLALASAYAGTPLGPDRLEMGGDLLGPIDLADITTAIVAEGCVGESLAALEAESALERAADPVVKEALRVISRDEAVHAELAWSFVGWAVATGGGHVAAAAQQAFRKALEAPVSVLEGLVDAELSAHGRLGTGERRAVVLRAMRDVIRPAAAELLAT